MKNMLFISFSAFLFTGQLALAECQPEFFSSQSEYVRVTTQRMLQSDAMSSAMADKIANSLTITKILHEGEKITLTFSDDSVIVVKNVYTDGAEGTCPKRTVEVDIQ